MLQLGGPLSRWSLAGDRSGHLNLRREHLREQIANSIQDLIAANEQLPGDPLLQIYAVW